MRHAEVLIWLTIAGVLAGSTSVVASDWMTQRADQQVWQVSVNSARSRRRSDATSMGTVPEELLFNGEYALAQLPEVANNGSEEPAATTTIAAPVRVTAKKLGPAKPVATEPTPTQPPPSQPPTTQPPGSQPPVTEQPAAEPLATDQPAKEDPPAKPATPAADDDDADDKKAEKKRKKAEKKAERKTKKAEKEPNKADKKA